MDVADLILQKSIMKVSSEDRHYTLGRSTEPVAATPLTSEIMDYMSAMKKRIGQMTNISEWDYYKKLMNDYEVIHMNARNKPCCNFGVAGYSPISRAFFKLWELVHDIPGLLDCLKVPGPIAMAGLAEGPGGFIECIAKIRGDSVVDSYYGITLRPTSSHIPGWKRHLSNFRVSYGKDGTGNIYNPENIQHFNDMIRGEHPEGADIVTADGGFDFSSDYEHQETTIKQLLYAEIVASMLLLKVGGTMVLKVFDMFESATADILWLIKCRFDDVYVSKPFSSRPANSEKYVVARGFRGIAGTEVDEHLSLLRQDINGASRIISSEVPDWFKGVIDNMNAHFCYNQSKYIMKTLRAIEEHMGDDDRIKEFKRQQGIYGLLWCKKYNMPVNDLCKSIRQR